LRKIWKLYKGRFAEAQHGRCGYCDRKITDTQHGDVEHYRPQGRVDEIDDPCASDKCLIGEEAPAVRKVSSTGYHWLAYAWRNYLLACQRCNQQFKRCLFPVVAGTRELPLTPSDRTGEQPLLLWCYGEEDPAEHLEFAETGSIAAKNGSIHGRETILTCGLSRRNLQEARQKRCEDAFEFAERILAASYAGRQDLFQEAMKKCLREGKEGWDLTGVFRIIIQQQLGLTWERIQRLPELPWDEIQALIPTRVQEAEQLGPPTGEQFSKG
jgi:hypothetical protein